MDILKLLVPSIAFIILAQNAFSHLAAGQDKALNGYLIDFGYDPAEPIANEKAVFAANILNGAAKEAINSDSVFVRISSSKESVFAGNLNPENGSVAFTFAFPYGDSYEVALKFFKDGDILAQSAFGIDVKPKKVPIYLKIIFGVLALSALFFVFRKLNQKSRDGRIHINLRR